MQGGGCGCGGAGGRRWQTVTQRCAEAQLDPGCSAPQPPSSSHPTTTRKTPFFATACSNECALQLRPNWTAQIFKSAPCMPSTTVTGTGCARGVGLTWEARLAGAAQPQLPRPLHQQLALGGALDVMEPDDGCHQDRRRQRRQRLRLRSGAAAATPSGRLLLLRLRLLGGVGR